MWEEIIHLLKNNIQGGDVDLSKLLDEEILRLGGFFRGLVVQPKLVAIVTINLLVSWLLL